MPPRYKTAVPASALTPTPFVVVVADASVSSSSSSAPSSSLHLVCQSPSWPAPPGLPSGFISVVAIVALVVVAVQRLRAAVHSRLHASRAVSSMSRAPAQPRVQPYDDQLPRPSQSPQRTPSQKRRGQPRASTSSISYSRPLVTVPLATSDRPWPPPPPMPTLSMLQWPAPDTFPPGARDEYYAPAQYQSPDQYDNQYPYGRPPVSAAPYPPSMGLWSPEQLKRSAEVGTPPRFFSGPPPSSSYTYPPPYPLGPLPRAETNVLPPLHPDVTDALLPGPPSQPQPPPQAEGRAEPLSTPPPKRSHRRSYSQKIIYPKSYSPGSQSTSRSAPELGRDMRDADPLTTPGGTTAPRGLDGPDGEAMGIEVSEEIIVAAEGWRRHTRVYGGGVCMACLESEAEMKERGMNLDVGPILMEGNFDPRRQQVGGESAQRGSIPMLVGGRSEDKGKGRGDDGGGMEETEGREGRGGIEGEGEEAKKMKEEKEDWWRQATTLEERKGEREGGGDGDHKSPRDEPEQAGKMTTE